MTQLLVIDSDAETHPGSKESVIENKDLRIVRATIARYGTSIDLGGLRSAPQPLQARPMRLLRSTSPPETTQASDLPGLS